jgi:hypothetical protein
MHRKLVDLVRVDVAPLKRRVLAAYLMTEQSGRVHGYDLLRIQRRRSCLVAGERGWCARRPTGFLRGAVRRE